MKIRKATVGKWKVNAYSIELNQKVWLIDPGDDFYYLNEFFDLPGKEIQGILATHGHFDHFGAVAEIQRKYNAPFYIHSKDRQLVRQGNLFRKLAGENYFPKTPQIMSCLDDIKEIPFEGHCIYLHYTPGHTEGSLCFEIENYLFSGDLLVNCKAGRTDLPGGNRKKLKDSLHYLADRFPAHKINPGHGSNFVINQEVIKEINNFFYER